MKNPDFSKIDFKANFESQSYEAWKAEIEKNTGMKFEELIEKSSVTSYKLLADLEKLDIIKEISGAQRNRLYVFKDYIDLFNND